MKPETRPYVFGRAAPLVSDEGRVVDVGLPVSDLFDDHVAAPVVAEVMDVEELLDAWSMRALRRIPAVLYILRSKCSSSGTGSL